MPSTRLPAYLALLVVGLSGWPRPASAYDLVNNEELRLRVFAFARAGYAVVEPLEGETVWEPYLGLARFGSEAVYRDVAGVRLNFDVTTGEFLLLDTFIWVKPTSWLRIRAGRFKTPTSPEFLVPAPTYPFVRRSLFMVTLPLRAIGVEVVGSAPVGAHSLDLQVGVFSPRDVDDLDQAGQIITTRVRAAFDFGLELSVAFDDLVGGGNPGDIELYPFTRHIDGAIIYAPGNWWLHAEVMKVLEGADGVKPLGAVLMAGVRLGSDPDRVVFEPVVAGDVLVDDGPEDLASFRAGLNTHLFGLPIVVGAHYRLIAETTGDATSHAGYLELRAGF